MTGDMTIREMTRKQTWDVTATLDGDTLRGTAKTDIKMTQYGVDPPDIAGFVRVEDDVVLTLDFVATTAR
jgi:polyisoprenoid-binding protein YceI